MENVSKALLITAAVLVAIILIALGVKIFSSSVDTTSQAETIGKVITDKGKSATAIIAESLGKAGGSSLGGGTTVDGTISGEIVSGVATTGVWTDNGDGTFSKGETKVAIGDIVKYNAKLNGEKTYTPKTENGAGSSATYNSTTQKYDLKTKEYKTEDLTWRVLGVNSDGQIELISTTTNSKLCLANAEGYIHGKDELDTFCKELYGQGIHAVTESTRSVTVDDINKITGYDPETYIGYGWGYEYTSGTFINEDGSIVTASNDNKVKLINKNYYLNLEEITSKEYKNLFEAGNKYYWLASPCVDAHTNYANFIMRYMNQRQRERKLLVSLLR